ncbi:hypothetical protein SLEP1_g31220 [Rubroshorea leprosula]|uniref:Uncharacterized protein n=1 Tax=Rubroshorea leprosula TaxID=152421 RepID=A0AAV5K510_9ROSI|nr:hypothetical protein SLEP1_g31220 [Rubroshorea leprosula]
MGDGSSRFPSVMQVLAAMGAAVVGLVAISQMGSGNNAKGGRMMKAPGGGGKYIPRAGFEKNPQRYFSDLRAGKKG